MDCRSSPGPGVRPQLSFSGIHSCGQAPSPGSQSSKSGPGESGLQALRLAFGISVSELQGSEAIPDKLRSQIFWLLCSWPHSKLQMGPRSNERPGAMAEARVSALGEERRFGAKGKKLK